MSVQSDVHEFLAAVAKGADRDWVPMDPGKVAEQTGHSRNKINKTLHNLSTTHKVELQRGQNGRSIVGFKLLAAPTETQRKARTNGRHRPQRLDTPVAIESAYSIRRTRRSVPTPSLDQYAKAKERFGQITEELGELVHAEFNENPYAEEGLRLRDRLDRIEDSWVEVNHRAETAERELASLRRDRQRELREAVEKSGQGVTHGD